MYIYYFGKNISTVFKEGGGVRRKEGRDEEEEKEVKTPFFFHVEPFLKRCEKKKYSAGFNFFSFFFITTDKDFFFSNFILKYFAFRSGNIISYSKMDS